MDHANYYCKNRNEFFGEDGHKKLLEGLKMFIPQNTEKQNICLDVGCCIGKYLDTFNDICKEKQIICFEPNPANLEILKPKLRDIDNITLYECCISDKETTANFYNYKTKSENNAGNGLAGLRSGGDKICSVDVVRLDTVLEKEICADDFTLKLVKIDTEGNDTNVIKSLGRFLQNTEYMIFECSDCLDDHRGPGFLNPMKDIVDYLSENGFDTYRIGTKKLLKVNDEYWDDTYEKIKFFSNCFALKKNDAIINKLIDPTFQYTY